MTHPRLGPGRLVLATHNPGKVREIGALVAPHGIEAVSAGALGLPEPPETGITFTANATIKALAAAQGAGLPALADDSGLIVDALDGAPLAGAPFRFEPRAAGDPGAVEVVGSEGFILTCPSG